MAVAYSPAGPAAYSPWRNFVRGTVGAWEDGQSLTSITPWVDWDSVMSMALSLRLHLFDHGTIPVWNFMFCGGRPELSIPYSWAYTWPSLFAYALPPLYAIVAVWLVLSAAGFLATRALLRRWCGPSAGASIGAALYVLSGCFASRFNAGHVTFAFYHLTPVLMLLFEVGFARALERRSLLGVGLASTLVGFLFMSAALPHPLLHFYPAFALLVLFRVGRCAGQRGLRVSLTAASVPAVAHALGLWLAAYKLFPVIRWQLDSPRQGMLFESYSVIEILRNTLAYVPSYSVHHGVPWHVYPNWGYNAFVGVMPWICAFAVVLCALAGRRIAAATGADASRFFARGWDGSVFAAVLIVLGVVLALGNDNPASPAYLFRHLPVLEGVRAFNRYQVLIVFGLAILVAQSGCIVQAMLAPRRQLRRLALSLLAVAVVGPVAAQFYSLAASIKIIPNTAIAAQYFEGSRDPQMGPPTLIRNRRQSLRTSRHETALLERGYWIQTCRSDLNLARMRGLPRDRTFALTHPPPTRLESLSHDSLTLFFAEKTSGPDAIHLRLLEGFDVEVDTVRAGSRVTVRARYPGPREGAIASGAGLAATIGFFTLVARREQRRMRE